jgi:hypothetical protein
MQEEEIKKMKEKEKSMKEGEAKGEPKSDDHH